jgi:hypothetical protein
MSIRDSAGELGAPDLPLRQRWGSARGDPAAAWLPFAGTLSVRVEAAGIEPASADAPDRASTSVVPDSDSPAGRFRDDTPDGLAILECRAAGDWLSLGAEPDVGAAFPASGRAGCDVASPKGYLGSDCEFVLRICSFPGGFTRPTGDLGLQLYRRTDHVETRSPPYVLFDVV